MGQTNSKRDNPIKKYKLFPDSPLGQMLTQWEENVLTKEKDQCQMIQYCMFNWPKRKIRKDGLKWPKHGSSEMWLCKAWYSCVHYRASKNSDELGYAKIWLNYWEKQEKEP